MAFHRVLGQLHDVGNLLDGLFLDVPQRDDDPFHVVELCDGGLHGEFDVARLGRVVDGCERCVVDFGRCDLVAATLRFFTHEYQGQVYQDILVTDIVKLTA